MGAEGDAVTAPDAGIEPRWIREPGVRVAGSRPLDAGKVQAPCAIPLPDGRVRLLYTAIGPERPFPDCQGVILSAISDDGLDFRPEPGIRLAPDPAVPERALRVLAPSVARLPDGRWRCYVEVRGTADRPTAIASAVSDDLLAWTWEPGLRVAPPLGAGAPRWHPDAEGAGGRLVCTVGREVPGPDGAPVRTQVAVVARSEDGLAFAILPGTLVPARTARHDSAGITAAQVVPPARPGEPWRLIWSAWEDRPADAPPPPLHPSLDPDAVARGTSRDFAAASIAADLSGYRSRLLCARSADGVTWGPAAVIVAGEGYGGTGVDAIHAEDMSVIRLADGTLRAYDAVCDTAGRWTVASARPPR